MRDVISAKEPLPLGGGQPSAGHVQHCTIQPRRSAGEPTLQEIQQYGYPQVGLPQPINDWCEDNAQHLVRGLEKILPARELGIPHFYGTLFLTAILPDLTVIPYGLASLRLVTDVGVTFLRDAFNNSSGGAEPEAMNFHGIGTGNTAEAQGDTDLQTELTTQYQTDNRRATGTQGTNGTNVYQTIGANTVDAAVAIVEHWIFSIATVGSGTLLDRSVFAVINLPDGGSLQSTYEYTMNAGG